MTEIIYRCSFCGKRQHEVARLIAGPGGVYICNECIGLVASMLEPDQLVLADNGMTRGAIRNLREQLRDQAQRPHRPKVLCELCHRPIRPRDIQTVIATYSDDDSTDLGVLWRSHAECFDLAAIQRVSEKSGDAS